MLERLHGGVDEGFGHLLHHDCVVPLERLVHVLPAKPVKRIQVYAQHSELTTVTDSHKLDALSY